MNPYETLIDTLLLPSEVAMPMSKRLLKKKLAMKWARSVRGSKPRAKLSVKITK